MVKAYIDNIHKTHGISEEIFLGLDRHKIMPRIYVDKTGRHYFDRDELAVVISTLMSLYIRTADASNAMIAAYEEQKKILESAPSVDEYLAEGEVA